MQNTTIAAMLQALQDPAGVPVTPWILQYLLVFTWAAHIAFVNLSLGSALLAIIGFAKRRQPAWARLSVAMTSVAKISVSMAIVLGVAPLLFSQTIYDPQWYTSNVLSAFWVIFFIFSLGIGYTLWFVFYFKNHDAEQAAKAPTSTIWWAASALAVLLFDGFIMHVLTYQSLLPAKWMSWYAPHGTPLMTGTGIHAFELSRFAFFIVMSLTMTGVFLVGYARYFRSRSDFPAAYLNLAHDLGVKVAVTGVALQLVSGVLWAHDLPATWRVFSQPLFWATAILLVGIALYVWKLPAQATAFHAYAAMALYALLALLVSIDREALRVLYNQPFGYDINHYKVHAEWWAFGWFSATLLLVGGSLVAFYVALLWKAGKARGPYIADRTVARLGTAAVWINFAWLAVFFIVGIWAYVRNVG